MPRDDARALHNNRVMPSLAPLHAAWVCPLGLPAGSVRWVCPLGLPAGSAHLTILHPRTDRRGKRSESSPSQEVRGGAGVPEDAEGGRRKGEGKEEEKGKEKKKGQGKEGKR